MPTDDERRAVARRLRDMRLDPWDDAACEIAQCAGIACCNSECHGSDETPECTMALVSRLADLIEPSCDRDTPQKVAEEMFGKMRHSTKEEADAYDAMLKSKSVEIQPVDRDALLALADEIDRKSNDGSTNPDPMRPLASSLELFDYARRIRKACGWSNELAHRERGRITDGRSGE